MRRLLRPALVLASGLLAAGVATAQDPPYADAWDPATVRAAEAAVARLGPARGAIRIVPIVLNIRGLALGVAGSGRGVVATVQQVRQAMQDLGARETELEVRVELPADVLFDFDKADIRADAASALSHLATVIRAFPSGSVSLEGHTDAVGGDAYNQQLSQRRAEAVKSWLVEREGIDAAKIATRGAGETRPVATNDTDEGRQKNRRVEVVIRKEG